MKIFRSPLRVSFLGGGTDFPSYFTKFGGSVISCAIDKFVYVVESDLDSTSEENYRISYSKVQHASSLEAIDHPSVREIFKYFKITDKIALSTFSDIPARSGLGGSSAFACAVILACTERIGLQYSPTEIAELAVKIEREVLGEYGGYQDQYASAFGNFRQHLFSDTGVSTSPPLLTDTELAEVSRSLYLTPIPALREANHLQKFKEVGFSADAVATLHSSKKDVESLCSILTSKQPIQNKIHELGRAVSNSHLVKATFTSIPEVTEELIECASRFGALGSKICGSGGGGLVLSVIDPSKSEEFEMGMKKFGSFRVNALSSGTQQASLTWN
jgi:D-glycero-alpha-D-manno-heptose-7-phosphate kinase